MEDADDLAPETVSADIGTRLRAAREEQGLSIADVANRTRIPSRHLASIEAGNYENLPAPTYSAGFVKVYGRLLGLDGQALSQEFRHSLEASAPSNTQTERYDPIDPARTPSRLLAWSMVGVLAVLLVGYFYWRGAYAGEDAARIATETPDRPVASAFPSAPAPVAAPQPLAPAVAAATPALLTAELPVWIRVYEMGGAKLFEGMLQPGEKFAIPATATDPRLLTGRPNALRITVGDAAIPALGPPEQRIKDVPLGSAALLARIAPAAAAPPIAAPTR